MELVFAAIISGIFFICGIVVLQLFWERKFKFNLDFEKFKIKERKKAYREKMKFKIKNPAPKDVNFWLDKIKGLNPDIIENILDAVSGEEKPSGEWLDSLGEGIGSFIENNPELVQQFLSKYATAGNRTENYER